MALTYTRTLTAGTVENVNHVTDNFNDVTGWLDSRDSAYASLLTASNYLLGGSTAGDYYFSSSGILLKSTTSNAAAPAAPIYFDDADYTKSGKTQKLRLRCQMFPNATAPTGTLTVKLFPISSVAGAAGLLSVTLGTFVVASNGLSPSASTPITHAGTDTAIPVDGHYTLGLSASGTTAANSVVGIAAQLLTRWV